MCIILLNFFFFFWNLCRKKNKKLIPIIFNRLRNYILFCEDNVINQSTKIFPNQDVKMEIDNIPDNWSSRTRSKILYSLFIHLENCDIFD